MANPNSPLWVTGAVPWIRLWGVLDPHCEPLGRSEGVGERDLS